MADVPRLLTTTAQLEGLAEAATAAGRIALDTEFVWERTYQPMLGVVQIATDDTALVLDARALPSLEPLFPLLRDPAIPVVIHGGGQDLEIFASLMGEPIRGVSEATHHPDFDDDMPTSPRRSSATVCRWGCRR